MRVENREKAWEVANGIFTTDYEKDSISSKRAGYDVYRHYSLNPNNRINDLGCRLEVVLGNECINIWIEPEIIKNMGTGMEQSRYEKLCGNGKDWALSEKEAVLLINNEFGFETSRVKIVADVEIFCKDGVYAKPYEKYTRSPQYCATDYNYIRFDVNGYQYEMINGSLEHYYN